MRMNKGAILASMVVIALASVFAGAGTMAYFSETETAGPNAIVATTIDLALTCDFELTDIFPSKELDPITVTFQNVGPIPGYMYSKVTYTENDETPNAVNISPDKFAALIYVKAVTYQHYSIPAYGGWGGVHDDLPKWEAGMDGNVDGYVSLYEMKLFGWIPYDVSSPEEPLPVGEGGRWVITLHMADSLVGWALDGNLLFDVEDNRPQADGIDVTFTALLKSSPGSP